ncbi:MAG: Ig-like domain-containing protein, partial [Desulfobacterales bacterium]|nr:Ig-like domain-containing protein [Desulfobacterales bacterium]
MAPLPESEYLTIHEITDMEIGDNTPLSIKASASGCCTDQYNWSLVDNPLDLVIDAQGNIAGNSGNETGAFTTTVRAEDADFPGNFVEESFIITVKGDLTSGSFRVHNDGVGPLEIQSISKRGGSDWLTIHSPQGESFTIEQGGFRDVYVTVDRQSLPEGAYSDDIVLASNDCNDDPISIPVNINVEGDSTPPPAPRLVSVSPSSWFGAGSLSVDYTHPPDPSGISGAYYKIDAPPTADQDGSFISDKPFTIALSPGQGERRLFIWCVDGAGNTDHRNMNSAPFYFDSAPPSIAARLPEEGASDAPVDANIFVQIMDEHAGVDPDSISLRVNGVAATPVVTELAGGRAIDYTPGEPFAPGEAVVVEVEASDLSSPPNATPPASWSFTTAAAPSPPLVESFAVNNGEAVAEDRTATLNNVASGAPTHYMAGEFPDFANASWLEYSPAPTFLLSEGAGLKTVYFKVKNDSGESDALSD